MRCGWCRRNTGVGVTRRGYQVVPTGRIAPLTKQQAGNGGGRVLQYRAEYRCADCQRTGWSRHKSMVTKLAAAGFDVPKELRGFFPNIRELRTLSKVTDRCL